MKKIIFIVISILIINSPVVLAAEDEYTINDNQVYFGSSRIEGVDANTFVDLGGGYVKDANNIYYFNIGSADSSIKPAVLQGADMHTFEVVKIDYQHYAKDKNNVYWRYDILDGADPATYEYLGIFYYKDKSHVYYTNIIMDGVDSVSFEIIGKRFSRDKNSYYYRYNKIDAIDYLTAEVVLPYVIKDKNGVYEPWEDRNSELLLRPLEDADSATFRNPDKSHAFFGYDDYAVYGYYDCTMWWCDMNRIPTETNNIRNSGTYLVTDEVVIRLGNSKNSSTELPLIYLMSADPASFKPADDSRNFDEVKQREIGIISGKEGLNEERAVLDGNVPFTDHEDNDVILKTKKINLLVIGLIAFTGVLSAGIVIFIYLNKNKKTEEQEYTIDDNRISEE